MRTFKFLKWPKQRRSLLVKVPPKPVFPNSFSLRCFVLWWWELLISIHNEDTTAAVLWLLSPVSWCFFFKLVDFKRVIFKHSRVRPLFFFALLYLFGQTFFFLKLRCVISVFAGFLWSRRPVQGCLQFVSRNVIKTKKGHCFSFMEHFSSQQLSNAS